MAGGSVDLHGEWRGVQTREGVCSIHLGDEGQSYVSQKI